MLKIDKHLDHQPGGPGPRTQAHPAIHCAAVQRRRRAPLVVSSVMSGMANPHLRRPLLAPPYAAFHYLPATDDDAVPDGEGRLWRQGNRKRTFGSDTLNGFTLWTDGGGFS